MSTVTNPSFRKRIGYHAGLLSGFSTLAAVLLMVGNVATSDVIEQRKREDMLLSLSQVMPASLHDNDLLANTVVVDDSNETTHEKTQTTVYRALQNKHVSGVAFQITGNGYAGPIELIMAMDANGELLGVRVLAHAETPGLGDKIEAEKTDWILRFKGLSLGNPPESKWLVKKDGGIFDQFSGATITPRGVVLAIKTGLEFFRNHKTLLLMPPADGDTREPAHD